MVYLLGTLLSQPDDNVGHRCGSMGFAGMDVFLGCWVLHGWHNCTSFAVCMPMLDCML